MFGLYDDVDGYEAGRNGRIGHHHDLRRTGEGRRHADQTGNLALSQGDVDISRTDDDIDRGDRLGTKGHGSHGLGATHRVDGIHPSHRGCSEGHLCDAAIRIRRYAHHDLVDTGRPGRNGGHENGRGVRGPSSRDIATRAFHGATN